MFSKGFFLKVDESRHYLKRLGSTVKGETPNNLTIPKTSVRKYWTFPPWFDRFAVYRGVHVCTKSCVHELKFVCPCLCKVDGVLYSPVIFGQTVLDFFPSRSVRFLEMVNVFFFLSNYFYVRVV